MRDHGKLSWDSAQIERRRDSDGVLYTLAEFRAFYGGDGDGDGSAAEAAAEVAERWAAAKHWEREMTWQIKRETSTSRLLELHAAHLQQDAWNGVHLNALWHQLGQGEG